MKRIGTGGPLNVLNELCACNSRSKTVAIMALLDAHPTDDPIQLEELIRNHSQTSCECGVRSTGPLESFATLLFEAQNDPRALRWKTAHRRHTMQECLDFHRALFCEAPIRGRKFELRSRQALEQQLNADNKVVWTTRRATRYEDANLAVDYIVLYEKKEMFGVQVKPHTALYRADIMSINRAKHAKCSYPVVFHIYDDDGMFQPLDVPNTLDFTAGSMPCP